MKYEEVIYAVGGCGRYQILILNLLYICTIFDGLQVGSMVFVAPKQQHRCKIPELMNDTYEVQNEDHADIVKEYIPEKIVDGESVYSQCLLFVNKSVLGNQSFSNCSSWTYDKSTFESTMTSEYNIVCQNEWLAKHVYTAFFAGYLLAMLGCGWLSDRFGRKTIIILALILQGAAGILSSQLKNLSAILVFRFLTAVGGAGSYIPSVTYATEITSVEKRTVASLVIQMYFTIGFFAVSLVAYLIRSWRVIALLVSLPSIPVALLYIWLIPESPRWLLTMKREKQATKILTKIGKFNKKDLSWQKEELYMAESAVQAAKLWKIFTIPTLLKRTVVLMSNWAAVSFVYYGLVLYSEHLSGNIFLNFFFIALVEFPAYILCVCLLNRVGRKKLYFGFMAISGAFAIATIFPTLYASNDMQWITTMFAIFSKLCVTGTFGIVYLHTCELYPTCVRNGALGAHSTFARFGGLVSPYILMLRDLADGKLGNSLPLLTMGIVCMIAAFSYFLLPETNNKPLTDTFEDLYKKDKERKKTPSNSEAETPLNMA